MKEKRKSGVFRLALIAAISAAIAGVFWLVLTGLFERDMEQQISSLTYFREGYQLDWDAAVRDHGEQALIDDYQSLIKDCEEAITAAQAGDRTRLLRAYADMASTGKKVKGLDPYAEQNLFYYEYLIQNGIRMNLSDNEPSFFNALYILLTGVYTLLLPLLVFLIAGQVARSLKMRGGAPSVTGFMRICGACLLPTAAVVLGLLALSLLRGDAGGFSALAEVSGMLPGAVRIHEKTYLSTGLAVLYTLIPVAVYSFFYSAVAVLITKWIPSRLCYAMLSLMGVLPALPILLGGDPPWLHGFAYWSYWGIGTGDISVLALPVILLLGFSCLFVWLRVGRNAGKRSIGPPGSA